MNGNFDWPKFFKENREKSTKITGYYNENYILKSPIGQIIVRKKIQQSEEMDIRVVKEAQLIKTLSNIALTPQVIWSDKEEEFQVHTFLSGKVVNNHWPYEKELPHHYIRDVVELFAQLQKLPLSMVIGFFKDWQTPESTNDFFERICNKTVSVHKKFLQTLPQVYEAIGLPINPFESLQHSNKKLKSRPMTLCHCDIHRNNCIIENGQTWFIDWELALIGDPLYDIAVHLHKISYLPKERHDFLQTLKATLPEANIYGLEADLKQYLAHENIKSVVVDSIRYYRLINNSNIDKSAKYQLASKLERKILNIAPILTIDPLNETQILDVFSKI